MSKTALFAAVKTWDADMVSQLLAETPELVGARDAKGRIAPHLCAGVAAHSKRLVEQYHRRARIKLPQLTVHATIHAAVENQLAVKDEPVVHALDRLIKQGLSRHDAIHAIRSVVATQIYGALNSSGPKDLRASYYAEIERLTAEKWLRSYDG